MYTDWKEHTKTKKLQLQRQHAVKIFTSRRIQSHFIDKIIEITIKIKENKKINYSKIWVWRSHIWVFKCAFWENDRWQNSHRNFFSPLHSYLKCLTALVSYLYCLPQLLGHWKTLCSNRPVRMVLVIDFANHTLLTWISETKIIY